MKKFFTFTICLFLLPILVLGQGQSVAVVYNSKLEPSRVIAEHYAIQRSVPPNNLIGLPLSDEHTIPRAEFGETLEQPLVKALANRNLLDGRNGSIRYLVLCWGVPFRVDKDATLKAPAGTPSQMSRNEASVDSELALLPQFGQATERTGFIVNPVFNATDPKNISPEKGVLMVARLDGPTADLANSLVDRAITAEKSGLWGRAYIDLRGIQSGALKAGDDRLRQVAEITRRSGYTTVVDEKAETLPIGFPGDRIAFYAGWYGINVEGLFAEEVVDFAPGAIAYHLHSYNGSMIRHAHSRWIGPFINKGATATFGSVFEPYLELTPYQPVFFARLIQDGFTFAEAGYAATRALSWQTVFVGDPLYRPFGKDPKQIETELVNSKSSDIEWFRLLAVNQGLAGGASPSSAAEYIQQLKVTASSPVLQEKLGELFGVLGQADKARVAFTKASKLSASPKQKQRIKTALESLRR